MKIGLIKKGKMNLEFLKYDKNSKIIDLTKKEDIDVIIDFSSSKNIYEILNYCKKYNLPLVIGTTGYNKKEEELIYQYSNFFPIFKSANFSFGINKINEILTYFKEYKKYILEIHQKDKLDIPSGTSLMINEKNEIDNIFSIRSGDILGTHEIILINNYEIINIKHVSFSRLTFIKGAILAAEKIKGLKKGFYNEL